MHSPDTDCVRVERHKSIGLSDIRSSEDKISVDCEGSPRGLALVIACSTDFTSAMAVRPVVAWCNINGSLLSEVSESSKSSS